LRLILSGTSKCSAAQRFSQDLIQIYGQSRLFGAFVRNRQFSISPFTDIMPIFSDLSVNDSDFAKCSD